MKISSFALLRSLSVLALSTALSLSVWADGANSEYRDLETVDVESRPAAFEKVRKASFQIGRGCTATFVSNDGYVLTALHCLQLDLSSKFQRETFNDMKFSILKFDQQLIGHTFDTTVFDGESSKDVQFTVVATGKGFFGSINYIAAFKANPEKYYDVMEEGYGPAEDYAVLKLNLENTPCLSLATEPVEVGDFVWSIGFPIRVAIGGRPLWSGKHEAYSSGQITNGPVDDEINKINLEGTSEEYQKAYLGVVGAISNEETLTASVDGLGGGNGGSVVNKKGEIVGVLSMTATANKKRYYYGTTLMNKVFTTVPKLKAKLGEERVKEIFSCR